MSQIATDQKVAAVGKIVTSNGRVLISISKDYADSIRQITTKRVFVEIKPLV